MEEDKRRDQGSSVLSSPSAKSAPEPLSLESARVLRLAEGLRLSPDTMERLKARMFGPLGQSVSRIEAREPHNRPTFDEIAAKSASVPAHYPKVERIEDKEAHQVKEIFTKSGASHRKPATPSASQRRSEGLEDEMLLRQKIEASPVFDNFKSDAWKLYEKYPRPDVAGRLVELALMYGSASELEEVLRQLNTQSLQYFVLLAKETRTQILLKLWHGSRQTFMNDFYFRKDMILHLAPVEQWYVAWALIDQGKSEQAYRWHKRCEHEIWNMQKQFGSTMQKSDSEILYALGSAAFRMDDEVVALKLLEAVPKNAPEFSKAIDLLLNVQVERDDKGYSSYELRLSRELDWKARLDLFDSFLLRIERVEHLAPKDRAALNALLLDPMRWFPDTAEAWNLLTQRLLSFDGLEPLLPNLLKALHNNALSFHKPSFEHAIWAPVLSHSFRNPLGTWYWRSIALVHEFALGLGEDEQMLWRARAYHAEAVSHALPGRALPISWQDLHRGLVRWVSKSERLDDGARTRLLMMTKLCGETREIAEADIHQYLKHVVTPSLAMLEMVEILARERKQGALEVFILSRKASQLHYTNQALARIWQLAAAEEKNDLCWRVATILHTRRALGPEIEKPWTITGERRREFTFKTIDESHLKKIFSCFEGNERKLVECIASVGALIPELLASLNPNLIPHKRTKAITKTEVEASEAIDEMAWFGQPRRLFSSGSGGLWQTKPPFFSNLAEGKWAVLYLGLSQRLGLNSWDWQFSLLNQHIETLIPKMTRSSDALQAGKVGRWLRGLSSAQRKAWYELAQLSKKIEDDKVQEVLGRFMAILTTTLYPDHISALATLERVRAPLRLRWDLENWIASETYGELRKSLGSHTQARLPDHVFRLAVLSPESPKMKP